MRKLMLMLLVAVMAAPAMAAVTISAVANGECGFDINYACTDADADGIYALMAGVAIIVSVDAGDTIDAVTTPVDGESTAGNPGYGVFMKTAQIGGDPLDWVTGTSPIATPDSPGEVGGIGEDQVTLEFGALYDADTDAPLASGTLCTIAVTDGDESSDTVVAIALEDVARGGIVMEGGTAPSSVVLTGATIPCGEPVCDENCMLADICDTSYAQPGDGVITIEDYYWLVTYYGTTCGTDANCLLADICDTSYAQPGDGVITIEDYYWLVTYYGTDCCP